MLTIYFPQHWNQFDVDHWLRARDLWGDSCVWLTRCLKIATIQHPHALRTL